MAHTITCAFMQRELNPLATTDDFSVQAWGFGMTAAAFLMRRIYRTNASLKSNPRMLTLPHDCLKKDLVKTIDEVMDEVMQMLGSLGVQNDYLKNRVKELLGKLVALNDEKQLNNSATNENLTQLFLVTDNLLKRLQKANVVLNQQAGFVTSFAALIDYNDCDCDHASPKSLLHQKMLDHLESLLRYRIHDTCGHHYDRVHHSTDTKSHEISIGAIDVLTSDAATITEPSIVEVDNEHNEHRLIEILEKEVDHYKALLYENDRELRMEISRRQNVEDALESQQSKLESAERDLRSRNMQLLESNDLLHAQSSLVVRLGDMIDYQLPLSNTNQAVHIHLLQEDMLLHLRDKLCSMQLLINGLHSEAQCQADKMETLMNSYNLQENELADLLAQVNAADILMEKQSELVVELARIVDYDLMKECQMVSRHVLNKSIVEHVHHEIHNLRFLNEETKRKLHARTIELDELEVENLCQKDQLTKQRDLLSHANGVIHSQSLFVERLAEIIEYKMPISSSRNSYHAHDGKINFDDGNVHMLLLHDEMLDFVHHRLQDFNQQLHKLNEDLVAMLIFKEQNLALESEVDELTENLRRANQIIDRQTNFIDKIQEFSRFQIPCHHDKKSDAALNSLLDHLNGLVQDLQENNKRTKLALQEKTREVESLTDEMCAKEIILMHRTHQLDNTKQVLERQKLMVMKLSEIVDYPGLSSDGGTAVHHNINFQRSNGIGTPGDLLSEDILGHVQNKLQLLKDSISSATSGNEQEESKIVQEHLCNQKLLMEENRLITEKNLQLESKELELRTELAANQNLVKETTAQIMNLEFNLTTSSERIQELEHESERLQFNNTHLLDEIAQKNTEISELEEALETLAGMNIELTDSKRAVEDEVQGLRNDAVDLQHEVNHLLSERDQFLFGQSELVHELCEIIDYRSNNLSDDLEAEAPNGHGRLLSADIVQHVRDLLDSLRSAASSVSNQYSLQSTSRIDEYDDEGLKFRGNHEEKDVGYLGSSSSETIIPANSQSIEEMPQVSKSEIDSNYYNEDDREDGTDGEIDADISGVSSFSIIPQMVSPTGKIAELRSVHHPFSSPSSTITDSATNASSSLVDVSMSGTVSTDDFVIEAQVPPPPMVNSTPTSVTSTSTRKSLASNRSSKSASPVNSTTTSIAPLSPREVAKRKEVVKVTPGKVAEGKSHHGSHSNGHYHPPLYSSFNTHVGVPLYRAPVRRSTGHVSSPAQSSSHLHPTSNTRAHAHSHLHSKTASHPHPLNGSKQPHTSSRSHKSSDIVKPSPAGVAELKSPAARLSSEDYCKNFSSLDSNQATTAVAVDNVNNEDDFFRFMSFQAEMPTY